MSKVKVTGNADVKIGFRAHIRQKWTDFRQTKTKVNVSPFYTYRRIHFTSGNASFLWYLSVIIRDGRMSQLYVIVDLDIRVNCRPCSVLKGVRVPVCEHYFADIGDFLTRWADIIWTRSVINVQFQWRHRMPRTTLLSTSQLTQHA